MQIVEDLENKTCYKHNQKILLVDLKGSKQDEGRYQCLKCLTDQIDSQNLAEVKDTKHMIIDIKTKQKEQKIEKKQQTINSLKSIQQNLCKFKELLDILLQTIMEGLLKKIQDSSQQLVEIEQQDVSINYSQDLNILSENYKGNYDYDIPFEKEEDDQEKEFIDTLKSQLIEIVQNQNYLDALQELDKIKSFQSTPKKKSWTKQQELNKTPFLKINCQQHGKEIIALNINQMGQKVNRLACIDCISQYPIQYITLEQANLKWNEIKGKQYDIMNQYAENRLQKKKDF